MIKFNHKQVLDQIREKFPNLHITDLGEGSCDIWSDWLESDLIGTIEAKHKTRKQFYTIYFTFHLRLEVLDYAIMLYKKQKEAIDKRKQGFNVLIEDRYRNEVTQI